MSALAQPEAQGPVARLFNGRCPLPLVQADLKSSTLTLRMDKDMPVPREAQFLVSESEALDLVAHEQLGICLVPRNCPVRVDWFFLGDDLDFQVLAPGFDATVYFRRTPGEHLLRAGVYWGNQTLLDYRGRKWTHTLPDMVTDDFGSLVPVTGGVL